jgi:hypothetical protein
MVFTDFSNAQFKLFANKDGGQSADNAIMTFNN